MRHVTRIISVYDERHCCVPPLHSEKAGIPVEKARFLPWNPGLFPLPGNCPAAVQALGTIKFARRTSLVRRDGPRGLAPWFGGEPPMTACDGRFSGGETRRNEESPLCGVVKIEPAGRGEEPPEGAEPEAAEAPGSRGRQRKPLARLMTARTYRYTADNTCPAGQSRRRGRRAR